MSYHRFIDWDNPEPDTYTGSFEVFYNGDPQGECGWYWWACWPGCLPDGEAIGPFDSEAEAIADAQGTGQ